MTKYRKRKFIEEESNGASGEFPEYGAIFMSNSSTRKECLRRELFGLPMWQAGFVKQVKAGMFLFLFEFESRELHGVFQASSDGAINIDPHAFCSSGKQFPAQVKFTEKWRCRPLGEMEFRHAISDNYFTAKKFNFGLSKSQVQRLLKLFSLKKVERSKPSRKLESRLGSTAGDRGFRNRRAEETEGDVDHEFRRRGSSAGDIPVRRLSENYRLRDKSDSGVKRKEIEYSRDASGVFRRLVDPKLHRSEDRYDFSKKNSSRTDDDADYSLVNGRRVPKKSSHTASDWLENQYQERDGFTLERDGFNREEHLAFEEDSAVPAHSSVPPESAYGTTTEYYDPCNPGIMGGAAMESSKHDIDEEPDYYIPMPTEHPEYQTNTGMTGAEYSESEYRYGHLGHSQLPGFLASAEATANMMMNAERLSYPSNSIYPSFAYPLSPNDGVDYKPSGYEHQEELGGHSSYSDDRVGRDSRIYPSFAYPSKAGDGVDLYQENRPQDKAQAYQQHAEFGGKPFDSDNRVIRMNERSSSPAEFERKRVRKSVFSRLVMPSKEHDAEEDTSPVTEPVDEVMAFLNDCQKHLMEQKRPDATDPARFSKPKKKKQKIHTKEVLEDDGLMLPFAETSVDCENRVEHDDQKPPFIDFKRRSQAEKRSGNPAQECKESLENSAPQEKKRKFLRPKLNEDDSEKDRGNSDNPIAPKSASEVPLLDLLARFGQ